MRVNLSFSQFDFKYNSAIQVRNNSIDKNTALSVNINLDENPIANIDFTTLPGFHQYNLNEWRYTLEQFFNNYEIIGDEIKLNEPYFNMVRGKPTIFEGEFLFIIESVLFAIIEKEFPSTLSFIESRNIKLNGLYQPAMEMESIPDCLKIKIRPTDNSLKETIEIISNLRLKNPEILFRLDGNRSFELVDLIFFVTELEDFFGDNIRSSIEYLEEPLKNHYDAETFFKRYPYTEALDESLISFIKNMDYIKNLDQNTNLILKPSLIGISKSFEIIEIGLKSHHNIVISSSYETKSAIRPMLFLAAINPYTYHGLDTSKNLPKELGIKVENLSLHF